MNDTAVVGGTGGGDGAPQLAVVTTAYNVAQYIDECAASALAEDDVAIEWVVYDDASTDETWTKLEAWARRDGRVRLRRGEVNVGLAEAQRRALAVVLAPVVGWLDGDDVACAGRWRRTVAAMAASPTWRGLLGEVEFIDEAGRSRPPMWMYGRDARAVRAMAEFTMPGFSCTSAWRTGWMRERLKVAQLPCVTDYLLVSFAVEEGELGWLPEVLAQYRWHGENFSKRFWVQQWMHGTALRLWAARRRREPGCGGDDLVAWARSREESSAPLGELEELAAARSWAERLPRLTLYHARRAVRQGRWRALRWLVAALVYPPTWRQSPWGILCGGLCGGAGVDREGRSRETKRAN